MATVRGAVAFADRRLQDAYCGAKLGRRYRGALSHYERVATELCVYGSDDAYEAERRMAETLGEGDTDGPSSPMSTTRSSVLPTGAS